MIFWFLLMLILAVIELLTVSLTSIWFAIGALCATIVALFSSNFILQFFVFILVSTLLLLCTRPALAKKFLSSKEKTNLDNVINKLGKVTEITDDYNGRVEVDGLSWKAQSNNKLCINNIVKIIKIEGVTLFVEDEG